MPARYGGDIKQTASANGEEGGDDVKSAWPLCLGLHASYNGLYNGDQYREMEEILKATLSSDCRLELACMKVESLVIAGQLHGGEYVPGPCTHRPSSHPSWEHSKSETQPRFVGERSAEGESDEVD